MFSHLKNVIDIVKTGVEEFRDFKSKKDREVAVLDLLKTYFLIKDCADEGENLIQEAGNDPVRKIHEMDEHRSISVLERWDKVLRKQGFRLHALQGHILGQDHLVVLNPELKEKLIKVVGYKMDRVVTLHGIGADLFLRNMFPIEETNEEKARFVVLMAGAEEKGIIDTDAFIKEIFNLRESLKEYREIVTQLVSKEELLALSKQARTETSYEHRT